MPELQQTLTERGSRYGDFSDNARVHQALLNVMMAEPGWKKLSDVQKSAMDLFAKKQARILNGDPNYKDNWHDIAGYAKLAEDRCHQLRQEELPGGHLARVPVSTAYVQPTTK